jgi:putative ABC transport system permease protein
MREQGRRVLEQVWRESAYAARVLRRAPALTLVSIATMGFGIGAGTLLFTLVNAIVLRPLPYPEPEALVQIFDTNPRSGVERTGVASGNVHDWRLQASRFDGIAAYYVMGRTISGDNDAEVVLSAQVTDDFFSVFGIEPHLGRVFTADEFARGLFNSAAAAIGPDPVAVISHDTWQQRFGSDPRALERIIVIDRRPFRIVGVMPAGFDTPAGVKVWIPWGLTPQHARDQRYLSAVARLQSGVTIAEAEDDLNRVAATLAAAYPESNRDWRVRLSSLTDENLGDTARILWILFAAVGGVLLVVCANVALLSIIRGLDRSGETAVRLALGAAAPRLFREFLMESVLLAALGGAAGIALAAAGLAMLPRLTTDLPRLDEVTLDGGALAFIAGLTISAALLSGLPPAWRRVRVAPHDALHALSPRTIGAGSHRLRDLLVVGQVALSVALVAGAGLLVRSVVALRGTHPGFSPRGVLVVPIFLDTQAYDSGAKVRAYYATLFERLAALPGVVSVGSATTVPTAPLGPDFERPVWPDGVADPAARIPAAVRIVTPGYVETLGLSIVDGRSIDSRDRPDAPRVVMVSQTLAQRLWPGRSAVGEQLVVDYSTAGTYPYEVVGVVGDVRFRGPRSNPGPEIYLAHAQRSYLIQNVTLRSAGDPRLLIPAVHQAMHAIDPHKPPHGVYALDDLLGATIARDRQTMIVLLVFAATALGLAVIGVYGVLAHRVRERRREIGIRLAMGAGGARVLGWVAGLGLRLVALGAAIGLALSWALRHFLTSLLYGVSPADPLTAVTLVALLAAIGLVAVLVPSWRATRIDPVTVLRQG